MRLPKNIIKKYGITKKAWSVFRSGKKTNSKLTTRGTNMAKRKKGRSKKRSSNKNLFGFNMTALFGAMLYGAVRSKTSTMLQPITAQIPLGNIADEVGMLGVSYMAKRFFGNKVPMLKEIANAGISIEAARIGEAIAMGQLGLGQQSTSVAVNSFR